jgi:hypothetical protein
MLALRLGGHLTYRVQKGGKGIWWSSTNEISRYEHGVGIYVAFGLVDQIGGHAFWRDDPRIEETEQISAEGTCRVGYVTDMD